MNLHPPAALHVLIVDDHPTLLWGLERLIASGLPGAGVATATTPEQALAQCHLQTPDLVVLDLDLEGRSGLDILPQLVRGGARVLVLTGERDPQVLERCVQHGARGVLRKDVPAEQLLQALVRVQAGGFWLEHRSLERVLHRFMDGQSAGTPDPEHGRQASLTARERKIIATLLEGQASTNKALAARLFISEHTLRNHLSAIYQKLGVANRLELYAYAAAHRMGAAEHSPSSLPA